MALSNWDLLAINKKGKSCDGIVKGKLASLEIYKNWVHIMSEKMWNEDCGFVKPVIATIHSGNMYLGGLDIYSIRHPKQSSIFVFVDATTYGKYVEGKTSRKYPNFFAGIGCYGYYDRIDEFLKWKNIDIECDRYCKGSRNYVIDEDGNYKHPGKFIEYLEFFDKNSNKILEVEVDEEFGELTEFVGVMPETLEAFKNWLNTDISEEFKYDKEFKKWLDSIDWNEITRFNQGDAFFVGSDNAETLVGKQDNGTILEKAFKK